MLYYKKSSGKYLAAVLCLVLLLVYTLLQMSKTIEHTENAMERLVEQNAKTASRTIEARVGFAESHIRVIAHNIGMAMNSPKLEQPHYVLNSYLDESPFSFIEYVRADGVNTLADGRELNAKDRIYYIEGMKGKSGIWANFNPALSREVLLNHYTPLYYGDKIVGIITGVVGGDTGLRSIVNSNFWNQTCYNILCDGTGRIVTSNFSGNLGQNLETFLLDKKFNKQEIAAIYDKLNKETYTTFRLEKGDGYALVSIAKIANMDFYVLQVVPASSVNTIRNINLVSYYGVLGALVLLLMVICLLYKTDSEMQTAVDKAKRELEVSTAISTMYNCVYIIDLTTDKAEEYMSTDELRQLAAQREKASEQIFFVMEHMAKPEWMERVLSFVDLSTLQDRLADQNSVMLDFEGVHVWVRSFFTVMERDEQQNPTKVLFVTRVIDQYMKDMQKLHRKVNVDQLTGLLNRTAFETNTMTYKDHPLPDNLIVGSIDVNSLKTVNDNIGHAAGDELIKGAAECMKRCLGSYGDVYRTGGDEFVAILFADKAKLEEIKKDLEASIMAWKGKLVPELNLACGYAIKAEHPDADFKKLQDIADKEMYFDKELYYSKKGLDRRRQQHVLDVVCSTYTKILRVNLTDDIYTVIRLDDAELNAEDRPTTISGWLQGFGHSSRIHDDDREKFLEVTNLEKLRAFFKSKRNHYSFYYRRDIGGQYKYVMMEIMVASDYTDDQQIVYLMVKDIGTTNL